MSRETTFTIVAIGGAGVFFLALVAIFHWLGKQEPMPYHEEGMVKARIVVKP